MTAWKLQKLVYYCQAWSLAWDEKPIFPEKIEAWANGPVVRELYDVHKGQLEVHVWPKGNPDELSKDEVETINAVLAHYGDLDGRALADLIYSDYPWASMQPGADNIIKEIPRDILAAFYDKLLHSDASLLDWLENNIYDVHRAYDGSSWWIAYRGIDIGWGNYLRDAIRMAMKNQRTGNLPSALMHLLDKEGGGWFAR